MKDPALGWRRRHPVLSRVLLYVAGALLVGGAVLLLKERKAQDVADREDYLAALLDNLGLVFPTPGGPQQVLEVLGGELGGPDVPPRLHQRIGRARGLCHLRLGDLEAAEAAFARAAEAPAPEVERRALSVERAEVHAHLGTPERALEMLAGEEAWTPTGLELFRRLGRAYALSKLGRTEEGLVGLDEFLDRLPRPAPGEGTFHLALNDWTLPGTLLHVTTEYVRLSGRGEEPAPWRRLEALAPDDPEVRAAVARALSGAR